MAKFTVGQTVAGRWDSHPRVMAVERRHVNQHAVIVHVQECLGGGPYGSLNYPPFYKLEYPSGAIDWADECTLEAVCA